MSYVKVKEVTIANLQHIQTIQTQIRKQKKKKKKKGRLTGKVSYITNQMI